MKANLRNEAADDALDRGLEDNLNKLKQAIGNSCDVHTREVSLDREDADSVRGALVYIEGMSDLDPTLASLLDGTGRQAFGAADPEELLHRCKTKLVSNGTVTEVRAWGALFDLLLTGNSILLLDGCPFALAIGTKQLQARSVEEPNVQSVVRGPREGFTEVLQWNTAMVRRKIVSPDLWVESLKIGEVTRTEVAVLYIRNIVSDEILERVRSRLSAIDIDAILESNYIEELIQDKQMTLFPTVFNTERPDVVAAGLLEGRVAILVNGTPFALLVPAVFTQFFQSSEDYYQRADFSTLIRLLRFLAFALALLTPSFYIAISTFHQEMLPTTLLFNLASQRDSVPFPAFVEALLMEVTFEILREASVRMPRTVGQSMSIVGTLVIGQAAVEAGLVSAAMVIVVSITAISNFVLPAFNMGIAARIVRFLLMVLAASFGLYGMFLGMIVIVLHLCGLTSLGVPYMSPLAPLRLSDQKDTFFRFSLSRMIRRPKSIPNKNAIRQKRR